MRWVKAYYIAGLLVFTVWAMFDESAWAKAYYMWDKVKDFILFYVIYRITPKQVSKSLHPVLIIAGIRIAVEIAADIWGVSVNNPKIVGALFIIYCIYVLYATIKEGAQRNT